MIINEEWFKKILIKRSLNLITLFIRLFALHSNIYKKQVFDFPKRYSYTNVCLKFLCDVIDNATSYF